MSTATHPLISVSEYLHTSYHPDCDYVDGVIEERDWGELDHAEVQRALILWLSQHERAWRIRTVPEIRLEDYRKMSVRNIWVIDPAKRKGFDCSTESWIETAYFAAGDTPIRIGLAALFAAIDEDRAR